MSNEKRGHERSDEESADPMMHSRYGVQPYLREQLDPGWNPHTKAAVAGYNPLACAGSVRPPIFPSSTYATPTARFLEILFNRAYGLYDEEGGPDRADDDAYLERFEYFEGDWPVYTRVSNPTVMTLVERMRHLELTPDGIDPAELHVEYFPSGLSAIFSTIIGLIHEQGPADQASGRHAPPRRNVLLYGSPVYGGTHHMFNSLLQNDSVLHVDHFKASDPATLDAKLDEYADRIAGVFVETPANPTLAMVDIEAVARGIRERTGGPDGGRAALIVDNTFMSPIFQHPLRHGADVVVYSGTKSLGGHSDLVAGFVVDTDRARGKRISDVRVMAGGSTSAFDAWLMLRSLDTLELRVKQQQASAEMIAERLVQHPAVDHVIYPKFVTDPNQHAVFERQCGGNPGAMITFEPKLAPELESKRVPFEILDRLSLWKLAVSLGGVESLAENPWYHTHADMSAADKQEIDLAPRTLRLSVGVEPAEDLWRDLDRALTHVHETILRPALMGDP
ncbi:MAG: L-methionine gamma-lyase [Calditrichaeota bacterium]|nr:L-methionine gamma-lyase [Calditrichota bacterium]